MTDGARQALAQPRNPVGFHDRHSEACSAELVYKLWASRFEYQLVGKVLGWLVDGWDG